MRLAELIRERQSVARLVAVLLLALAVGVLVGAIAEGGGGTRTVTVDGTLGPHAKRTARQVAATTPLPAVRAVAPSVSDGEPHAGPDPSSSSAGWRGPLTAALEKGVDLAKRDGGMAAAAVWVDDWSSPVVIGPDRPDRMWSISKPVAAIATLQASNGSLSANVNDAMIASIQRSDNCSERGVVLTLQRLAGGNPDTAARRFDDTLEEAGVQSSGPLQILPASEAGTECLHRLESSGISGTSDSAPGFGTYSWTLRDAVSFAHALADGRYGGAGETVLALMRLHKDYGLEPDSTADYTSPLDWPPSGGTFPAVWHPAYKGGWGGHASRPGFPKGDFMAAQIVVLDLGGHRVALAARFWPSREPSSDDPGVTPAPQALHGLFDQVQETLAGLQHHG